MDCARERELCRKYAGRIRGYGLRHLRDDAAADDLVQHVLLLLLTAMREGRAGDPERLDGWVLVTCRNSVMELRRGEQRRRRLAAASAALLPEGYVPEWTVVNRERLEACLMGLEPRERSVVTATFIEDRDAGEIGEALQITAGNVRVIRHRALVRLQACVEGRLA
jgi:RNA polymerase sigma-70 factor, ECF subfamily